MNTKQTKSTFYYPPVSEVIVVAAGGLLCVSNESYKEYDGNVGFNWEEE